MNVQTKTTDTSAVYAKKNSHSTHCMCGTSPLICQESIFAVIAQKYLKEMIP